MALIRIKHAYICIGHHYHCLTNRPGSLKTFCPTTLILFLLFSFRLGQVDAQRPNNAGGQTFNSIQSCQSQSGGECTCLSHAFTEYFQEAFMTSARLYSREPEVMSQMIDRFHCQAFIPLPPFLLIEVPDNTEPSWYFNKRRRKMRRYRTKRSLEGNSFSDMYDRRTRRKRELSLGFPSAESFAEAIANIPRSSSHHYAPLGSRITLHCFAGATEEGYQDYLYGYSRRFQWTHVNGMPITAPSVILDQFSGDLTFTSLRIADTGIYNCSVTFDEDEEIEVKSFTSQLDVITSPMVWLQFGIAYGIDRCRHRELFSIQDHIPEWVHRYVCHFCPVRNVSVTCINLGQSETKYVQISFALSSIGFERLMMNYELVQSNLCPVECLEKMHVKILTVILASLTKLFTLKIKLESLDGKTTEYYPEPTTLENDLALGCPAGFFENYKLCFPCAAGKYSPHGKDKCFPCPEHFFQPNPGSSACFPCPRGYLTLGVGAHSQTECVLEAVITSLKFAELHWIWAIIGMVLVTLIIMIVMICCCCPDSAIGKCLRCTCCCKEKNSFNEEIQITEHERLITGEHTDEEDDRGGRFASVGRRKWWSGNRPPAPPRFPRCRDKHCRTYDDDRKTRDQNHHTNLSDSSSVFDDEDLKPLPPEIAKLNLPSPASLSRNMIHTHHKSETRVKPETPSPSCSICTVRPSKNTSLPQDILEMNLPSPASLSSRNQRHHAKPRENCRAKLHLQPLKSIKQTFSRKSSKPEIKEYFMSSSDDSKAAPPQIRQGLGKKGFRMKRPHLKLGNILNTSKSLQDKLARQRRKIGDFSSRSKSSVSSLGNKLKKATSSFVRIRENKNTYHGDNEPRSKSKSPLPKFKDVFNRYR